MNLLVEKGMRERISYIAKRYSKSNNKYMTDYYNSKNSIYNIYLYAKKLYSWAMNQYLPYGRFR